MDPIEKLTEAMEVLARVNLDGPPDAESGATVAASYEAIRTWSLASIAHELHHVRHDVHALAEQVINEGVSLYPTNAFADAFGLRPRGWEETAKAAAAVRSAAALPPWLTGHNDGTISIDTRECTDAEADRRTIVGQLYRDGWRPVASRG